MTEATDVSAAMLRAVNDAEESVRRAVEALPRQDAADALDILRDRLLTMLTALERSRDRPE